MEKWIAKAAGKKNTPYEVLTYLHYQDGLLVGTDSYRLHAAYNQPMPDTLIKGCLVPTKYSPSGGTDSSFPNYKSIFHYVENLHYRVHVSVKEFTKWVRANRPDDKIVRLDFYPERDQVAAVTARFESHESFAVQYNATYLLDALSGFKGVVTLSVSTSDGFLLIGDMHTQFAVIMPVAFKQWTNRYVVEAQ